jgi:hypothetical protein
MMVGEVRVAVLSVRLRKRALCIVKIVLEGCCIARVVYAPSIGSFHSIGLRYVLLLFVKYSFSF